MVKFSVYLDRLVFVRDGDMLSLLLFITHNQYFEQKCETYENFLTENFHFLMVKFSVYLNRRVFVMNNPDMYGLFLYTKR